MHTKLFHPLRGSRKRPPWRVVLALLSGFLLYAAFPPMAVPWCAWIAPALLMIVSAGSRLRVAWLLGFLSGMSFNLFSLRWVVEALSLHGGFKVFWSVVTLGVLAFTLSLYYAVFSLVVACLHSRWPRHGMLAAPSVWVALELLRSHILTGFPWNLLGNSQHSFKALIQIASFTGVYGVSFVCAAASAAFATLLAGNRGPRLRWLGLYLVLTVMFPVVAGQVLLSTPIKELDLPPLDVACIQANISQKKKWSPASTVEIFRTHVRMTKRAAAEGASLVVWSESSVPLDFKRTQWYKNEVRNMAMQEEMHILLGSTHWVLHREASRDSGDGNQDPETSARVVGRRYYNSAFLINPDGTMGRRYDKIKLVPFSEYNPYTRLFWFFPRLVHSASDFTPGQEHIVNRAGDYRLGTFICYEAIFPGIVRRFVQQGADLLINITNDAWFGSSAAPSQHFLASVFRAVENRRWLVRCANTGISAIIDPKGRCHSRGDLMEECVLISQVRAVQGLSWYTRHGDVFAISMALVTSALVLAAGIRRKPVSCSSLPQDQSKSSSNG